MRSALYYPHTEVAHPNLIKMALLLWDRLEFIVPHEGFRPHYDRPDLNEAVELIGSLHVPTDREKAAAHEQIEDLVARELPPVFYYQPQPGPWGNYFMWTHKLLPETWDLLNEAGLTGGGTDAWQTPLEDMTGLALMSILADCCAGDELSRVTDRGSAYATLTNLMVEPGTDLLADYDEYDKVVPFTLGLIDATSISLARVLDFRRRAEAAHGHDVRELRYRYLQRIDAHIRDLSVVTTTRDAVEIGRQFEKDMADDLQFLRDELRLNKWDALTSKEVIVSIVAAAGSLYARMHGLPVPELEALSWLGAPVTIGGVLNAKTKFAISRKAIMARHPMAYMLELQNRR